MPFGRGKSGDSMIIEGMEVIPLGGGKSGESMIIGGMAAMPEGRGKSGDSTIIEGNIALSPFGKGGGAVVIDGGRFTGELITTGCCVFGGLGVLSRTISGMGTGSRTINGIGCEGPASVMGFRETGVNNMFSVVPVISPGGNFGDDLSVTVNGVSGTEGGEVE